MDGAAAGDKGSQEWTGDGHSERELVTKGGEHDVED